MAEGERDDHLDGILNAMNFKGEKRPSDDLPSPVEPANLTPEQAKILDDLPEEKGFYWIENNHTRERTVALIDKSTPDSTVVHWGHKMHARSASIAAIERWLDQHMILDLIPPCKNEARHEGNSDFGMF